MQIDPALKQILLRKTGAASIDHVAEAHAGLELSVAARLVTPDLAVDGLRIVARFGSVVTGRVALGALGSVRGNPNVASLKASRGFDAALARSIADIDAS